MSSESNPEVYDFEANLSEERGLVLTLNDWSLEYLIEVLQDLKDVGISGRHFHFDKVSGLEGNVPSIIFMRR